MKIRNSDDTRKRLLEAAKEEFAAYGIAGARVDRIATASGCNKQAIYAYFQNKDGLFDAVYAAMVVQVVEAVPIDGNDLPAYAAKLFDCYRAQPEVLRLALWHQLEKAPPAHPDIVVEATRVKLEAIQKAQMAGTITSRLNARDLLSLVLQLSMVSLHEPPGEDPGASTLRAALIEAVKRVVTP